MCVLRWLQCRITNVLTKIFETKKKIKNRKRKVYRPFPIKTKCGVENRVQQITTRNQPQNRMWYCGIY